MVIIKNQLFRPKRMVWGYYAEEFPVYVGEAGASNFIRVHGGLGGGDRENGF
jgi:hypothetical protein